ncbi:glycosyltransferase family 2 protein [Kozakia baliensis]|uniref:glycosyltransferase family 2 protein n=1 Tax=Kozakia baliensis TaxID=153496 RepID=UPI00345B96D9
MKFSIILPVYKAAGFVERSIRSVQNQTLAPDEIIIIDDCSPDNTLDVVKNLTKDDARVRIFQTPQNGGPSLARNIGLEQATGDWVAILDADDAYAPNRLETLVSLIESDPSLDVVADDLAYYDAIAAKITGRALGPAHIPSAEITLEDYLAHTVADGKTLDWGLFKPVFRRNFLNQHQLRYPTNRRHGEDYVFMLRLLSAGARFRVSPEATYLYTQREGAISRRKSDITRTSIAYDSLIAVTQQAGRSSPIVGNPKLESLIARRVEGLTKLDDAHFFSVAIRRGDLIGLIRRAVKRPAFIILVARQIGMAVKRRLVRR